MPRFFFHIRSADARETDQTGIEFSSLEEAIDDARRARTEMRVDAAAEPHTKSTKVFEITDEQGRVLATIPLLDS